MIFDILATRDSDAIPFKTVAGELNLIDFKSVAMGALTILDVNINTVDLSKAFIVLSNMTSDSGADTSRLSRFSFLDSDTVRIQRSGNVTPTDLDFMVFEALDAVSVNFYSGSMSSGTLTTGITITAVDLANRILVIPTTSTSAGTLVFQNCSVAITTTTNVDVTRASTGSTTSFNFFVVELPPL